jgi:hypothetical protein
MAGVALLISNSLFQSMAEMLTILGQIEELPIQAQKNL